MVGPYELSDAKLERVGKLYVRRRTPYMKLETVAALSDDLIVGPPTATA